MAIYFDDIEQSWTFLTARRTVLDADIINFCGISGDFNPIHIDDLTAQENGFGRRIAHGMLVASIVSGLHSPFDDMKMVAFLETKRKFIGPVFAGDTIWAEYTVTSLRQSKSKPQQGIVEFSCRVLKQDGIEVQIGPDIVLLETRQS